MSTDRQFSGTEKKFLYETGVQLRKGYSPSTKQMQWLHSLFQKEKAAETASTYGSQQEYVSQSAAQTGHQHLCVRLAWHDTAWNGNICISPEDNVYCVGEQSLLSDRLRRRRDLEIECALNCRGKSANSPDLGDYQPPCFWSINAFGKQSLEFSHDNPAEASYPHIKEKVPPYSVISWPFDLAFVRDTAERKQLGSYYPKEIFERRIKSFHAQIIEKKSILFLYCKFSNPVSGDDSDYLLVGCGLVSEKGPLHWFNVDKATLQATKDKKQEPNFPTLNWALRYSMDFENTGVRLPYQEYLALANSASGLPDYYLEEIKVVIREPELIDGFTYVAKHVDDDQAIFLLMKLRQSLLEVKRHGLIQNYDTEGQLSKIDALLEHAWSARGYFPGLRAILISILNRSPVDTKDIDAFASEFRSASKGTISSLLEILSGEVSAESHERLAGDIIEKLEEYGLEANQFLRLASMNLTSMQFKRILKGDGISNSPDEVADNPYLLFESYTPQEQEKDKTSGEKLDSEIDLFKIDIALFPQRRYQVRSLEFHNWKLNDKRRVRAVLTSLLRDLESKGHCYNSASHLAKQIGQYPLFYQIGDEYQFNVDLETPDAGYRAHFENEVVLSKLDGQTIYYLKEVYDNEKYVSHTIEHLMSAPDNEVNLDPKLLEQAQTASLDLHKKLGTRFSSEDFFEERERLYTILPYRKFSVLTGSPGAGKSYELLKLISFLGTLQERYLILSLTGKAVLRLRNNELGIKNVNAKTIDKFIAEIRRQSGVKTIVHTLIIEEASMADLTKLADVLRAVDPLGSQFRRLILVGDENQLPPIGYGKPFADIVDSLKLDSARSKHHFVSLTTNCRAELPEDFIAFTKVFSNENRMSERVLSTVIQNNGTTGLTLRTWNGKDDLFRQIKDEFQKAAKKPKDLNEGLDRLLGLTEGLKTPPAGLDNFQIITPYRAGFFGISGLNLLFQSEFRSTIRYTKRVGEISFKVGDKLMHTKNEYNDDELFVSNGSLGVACDHSKVFFSDKDSPTPFSDLRYVDDLQLAYAITVHKSQGSGFGQVFVVLPNKIGLLSRELLFTALTRTKNHLTLFIQANNPKETSAFLDKIRGNSSITGIRTTLSLGPSTQFAYIPEEGVEVKSRVEYIIYRKLSEAAKTAGFAFKYENPYELKKETFNLHPDFTIWLPNSKVIYWEHLGRLTDRAYVRMWDSRRAIYESMGDFDKVMTTDELNGISDEKIGAIVRGVIDGTLATEDTSGRYSRLHVSLR
jgi:exodeoxyribonuclease V alpha subunit